MTCCGQKCALIAGTVTGALIAVLGGILIPAGNLLIENTVKKEAVLENGTVAFDAWTSVDTAVYRQFWIYDVQNPNDVLHEGAKPVLLQKGPYTYRTRYIPKSNITFYSNFTVSFVLPAGAVFEPSMSAGPEEDTVTSLNLAVAGVYSFLDHKLANWLIQRSNSSLFQKRSIRELLWGYKDPMLNSMLGVFYPYNGTTDGPYTVFTGKDDINKVATINRWQYEQSVSYWSEPYCNMINGSDGSSFPPFRDKKERLFFFSPDICSTGVAVSCDQRRSDSTGLILPPFHIFHRSISAEYDSTVDLKGIHVYRYILPPEALESPAINPDNQCYCTDPVISRNCTVAGLLDITACRGIPIYISLPHFLYGSLDLVQGVKGLNPNFEEHSIFLDVEPITGFTLRFAKRLQINMIYGPSDNIVILRKMKDYTVFPVLWVNETAVLDDETADMFKRELMSRLGLLEGLQIGLLTAGSAIFLMCFIGIIVVSSNSKLKNKLALQG